jgi:6-phosphogluconolactonase (cycloisomerase 2 family)
LDGDGKLDLVVANGSSNTVSVFRNTSSSGSISSSSFAAKVDFTAGSNPQSVAIGDLDGDGKPDLVTANRNSTTVSVFRNTSSSGSISSSSFATKVDFTTGSNPRSVAIGDMDGDGKPDLALANAGLNTVSVFRNTSSSGSISSSSFAAKVDFTTGSQPISVAIGDLDGDGKPDLAVANYTSNTVSLYRNTSSSGSISSGSFATKVDFPTGSFPQSVAIGDLDGDGKPDLALANEFSSTVSVYRNTSSSGSISSSSFATKVDFPTGTDPISVAIGDLDGDGKSDLALANQGSNTVSIFRNMDLPPTITSFTPLTAKPGDAVTITGTGFNTTAANNLVFLGATRATVTAASAISLTVTVPTGATYAPITVLNTSASLAAYSLANFTPTYSPAKTSITSTDFLAKQDFTTGSEPYSVAIGDLDGDGKARFGGG